MAEEQIIVIKKKSGHGGHHGGAWKVAYADFVTAMMALFIVLWLMNSSKTTQEDIGGYFRDPHGISEKKGIGLGGEREITAPKDDMAKLKNEMMQSLKKMPEFEKISKQVEFSLTPEGLRIEMIDDGTTTGAANTTISTTIASLSATSIHLNGLSLTTTSGAQSALTAINAAISQISAQRGQIGASVNRLQAATTVMSTQVQNLQSASNSIEDADIGATVAQMTQFNILQSTGMAALQQANSAQQNVLKLLQ